MQGPIAIRIPPPSRPVADLARDLASPDQFIRARAAWELAGAAQVDEAIVAALARLLDEDEAVQVQEAAAWALGHIDHPAAKAAISMPEDVPPKLEHIARPQYPSRAFTKRIQGTVDIVILIGRDGLVVHAEVRQSIPALDEAALATVRQWRFTPATRRGRPIPMAAKAPVTFQID